MRRAILAVTGTLAGLVALLSFKSHAPATPTAAVSASGSGGTSAQNAAPRPATLPPGERAVTGNVADTAYGPVQVELVVKDNKIVNVSILEQPSSTAHDLQIGQFAFPRLIRETLQSQSAKIDAVSDATYTSEGYIKSLQSAIDNGV